MVVVVVFSASPLVVPGPCEIVVMTDFTITEFWWVSFVSPTASFSVLTSRISLGCKLVDVLFVVGPHHFLVDVVASSQGRVWHWMAALWLPVWVRKCILRMPSGAAHAYLPKQAHLLPPALLTVLIHARLVLCVVKECPKNVKRMSRTPMKNVTSVSECPINVYICTHCWTNP